MARILIIDDEEMVRRSISMVLRFKGWDTVLAEGGQQGLELARRETPDLIVCDVNMPDWDGLRTLAELRRDPALKQIPVVMVTGRSGEAQEHEALSAGAAAILLKPFNNTELLNAIQSALPKPPPAQAEP